MELETYTRMPPLARAIPNEGESTWLAAPGVIEVVPTARPVHGDAPSQPLGATCWRGIVHGGYQAGEQEDVTDN